jgi:hypothetical protein
MYYTFLSHSLNLGDLVLCQIGLLVGLWELISFPFCLLRQSWIQTRVLTSLMSHASFPLLVPAPQGLNPTQQRMNPSSRSIFPLAPSRIFSLVTREMTNHHLHNPRWDLKWHRHRGLVSKGWVLRTKRSHLIYTWKLDTKAKSKVQPICGCKWPHQLFPFPSAMTFMFFKF